MTEAYVSYRVFISSPGDVAAERKIAGDAIAKINIACRDVLQVSLDTKKWEDMPPLTPNIPEEKIQDVLNKEVAKSHFFLLILHKRYGRAEPGHSKSNTERELDAILECHKKNPQVKILAYFKGMPKNVDPGEQEKKVIQFRQRLEERGVLYKTFARSQDFERQVTHDLYTVLLRMRLSPFKQNALQTFWRFGEAERDTHPRVAVLYPPVQREFMGHPNDNEFWYRRLEPNVYFEDHKAVEKVRKSFALLPFRDYRVYVCTNPPSDIRFMNRVWICMPRHKGAVDALASHADISRFRFLPRTVKRSARIVWRLADGTETTIESPLAKYLRLQRQNMDMSGEWNGNLGRIVARDYAVLARFRDKAGPEVVGGQQLCDYFFAGIRGLGTWGAAWFVDRNYKFLQTLGEEQDIQLLLEVTFCDDRILDVKNVSDKPAAFFDEGQKTATIKNVIKEFDGARNVN